MTYAEALAEARLHPNSCSNPALMAQWLATNAKPLLGAASPEPIWNGAQKQGMTAEALAELARRDPMAAASLMFDQPTPPSDPITRDCDGTKQQGTRNCPDRATWNLRTKDSKPWTGACNRHLAQVGTWLLEGEQGDLDVRRIVCAEH